MLFRKYVLLLTNVDALIQGVSTNPFSRLTVNFLKHVMCKLIACFLEPAVRGRALGVPEGGPFY